MAENLFNVGTRLSASDYLQLISFTNKREMDDNRLIRGLGTLTGVSTTDLPSSGLETTLRKYSTANDEEITGKIIYGMADGEYKTEKDYVREYKRRNYPPLFMEKALAEWRRTKGQQRATAAEVRAEEAADFAADTARHQEKMRPGLYEKQQLDITAADKEASKKMNEKYAEDLSSEIAMNAYDYVQQDMDREIAFETAIEQARSKFKKGEIAGGYDSPWARSAYVKARDKFDKLVAGEEATKPVYDTRNFESRWMTESELQAINKAEGAGTILPSSEKPLDAQQVAFSMMNAAAKVIADPKALERAEVDELTARQVLQEWAQDKTKLTEFASVPEEHRKLLNEWWKAYEAVVERWYMTKPSGTVVIGD